MAKKPEFKLFRICDKTTGKAFSTWGVRMKPIFTEQGSFWRKPESIRKHLKDLCSNHEFILNQTKVWGWWERRDEIPNEYKRYYVEVYAVVQLSMHTEEAAKYLGK